MVLRMTHKHTLSYIFICLLSIDLLLYTFSYTIAVAYAYHNNFPFNTYGETVFILVQGWLKFLCFLKWKASADVGGIRKQI